MTGHDSRPPLGATQTRVLNAIRQHIEVHGYPPSQREVSAVVGLASPSTVTYHINKLTGMGYLRRDPNRSRAIAVVQQDSEQAVPSGQ